MRKTIFRSLLLVSLITAVLILPVTLLLYYHTYSERIEEDLFSELSYVEALIAGGAGCDSIPSGSRRLSVIDSTGTVLYDSAADESGMDNHLEREEVREALENGIGLSERRSSTLSVKSIYAAKKTDGGLVIRLSTEAKTLVAFLSMLFPPLLLVIIAVLVIMLLLSGNISRRIVRPINSLNLDKPGENETYEELSPLLLNLKKEKESVREQIEKSEEKKREFELITSSLEEGLAIVNKNGTLLSHNRSFTTLLAAGGVTSTSVFSYFQDGEGRKALLDALNGKRREVVFPVSGLMIEEAVYPSSSGGIIILLRNVTERVERENMRKEFTANVSHEMKTPLTTISGFAELLMTGTVSSDKVVDFSSEIYREAGRMIALVEDILNLSSLDENRETECGRIDLSAVGEDVVSLLAFKAEKNGVEIVTSFAPAPVTGSLKLFHEIIYNLLDNAVRYSKSEGGKAYVTVRTEGETVILTVEDNGIGIAKEHQSRIFERFYRVDKSRSKSEGGTGLGLSIVKNAALRMNGKIKLESEAGKGTRIEIAFPLSK